MLTPPHTFPDTLHPFDQFSNPNFYPVFDGNYSSIFPNPGQNYPNYAEGYCEHHFPSITMNQQFWNVSWWEDVYGYSQYQEFSNQMDFSMMNQQTYQLEHSQLTSPLVPLSQVAGPQNSPNFELPQYPYSQLTPSPIPPSKDGVEWNLEYLPDKYPQFITGPPKPSCSSAPVTSPPSPPSPPKSLTPVEQAKWTLDTPIPRSDTNHSKILLEFKDWLQGQRHVNQSNFNTYILDEYNCYNRYQSMCNIRVDWVDLDSELVRDYTRMYNWLKLDEEEKIRMFNVLKEEKERSIGQTRKQMTRFTDSEKKKLYKYFHKNKYPSNGKLMEIAVELNIELSCVRRRFNHLRALDRNEEKWRMK